MALPQALEQVAEDAPDIHYCCKDKAVVPGEIPEANQHYHYSGEHAESKPAEETHPGLLGRDFRGKLMLAVSKEFAYRIGADVGTPD